MFKKITKVFLMMKIKNVPPLMGLIIIALASVFIATTCENERPVEHHAKVGIVDRVYVTESGDGRPETLVQKIFFRDGDSLLIQGLPSIGEGFPGLGVRVVYDPQSPRLPAQLFHFMVDTAARHQTKTYVLGFSSLVETK